MNADPNLPAKEKLVMTHGYGGSIIMFWPVLKELAQHYHLIMFDILGMGSSSRPEFVFENAIDANDFFVEWMEKWRKNTGILNDKFILCGHSFGGYISGHYTKRYPQNIKKLLLLSPFGVPKRTFTDD
jgi:cardiolipin-specific phospholipase